MNEKVVLAVEKSANSKTGLVSVTYAPIQSCPETCKFLNSGCYAQLGHCGIHLNKINKVARTRKLTRPIDIAQEEAKAIQTLSGTRPLRLHVVGDCKTSLATQIVAQACKEYRQKNNQSVWTYTHAWRVIPREKWGDISVLASCETISETKQAMERGYAASIVRLKEFEGSFLWQGIRMTACIEMTKGITCNQCKICFNDKKLRDNKTVVCFFPHGSRAEKAKNVIQKIH